MAQIPEPKCSLVCCGNPCESGHASSCRYYNSSSNSGTNWAEAQQARQEARQEQKRLIALKYNELGNAEYRKRNWADAVKYYKKALRNSPYDPVIRDNLKKATEYYDAKRSAEKTKKEREKKDLEFADQLRKSEEEKHKKELEKELALKKIEEDQHEKRLSYAQNKISSLQKNIAGIQQALKVYSKSLHNNADEFEKWGNTVDEAYKNVIENTRDEIKDYFIKISLLAAFGPATQKAAFTKIRSILQSNDPQMQKWLAVETKLKGITPDKVEDLVDKVEKGFDLNDLLKGEQTGIKPKLDAMLFVNSLFETFNICDYKKLMVKEKLFGSKEIAGEYFDKAKLIGETYTDLTSICYSWFMINKLTGENEEIAQKVNLLSFNMQYQMKQIDCLKKCMKNYTQNCNEKCTGVTKLSTPPPLLK